MVNISAWPDYELASGDGDKFVIKMLSGYPSNFIRMIKKQLVLFPLFNPMERLKPQGKNKLLVLFSKKKAYEY